MQALVVREDPPLELVQIRARLEADLVDEPGGAPPGRPPARRLGGRRDRARVMSRPHNRSRSGCSSHEGLQLCRRAVHARPSRARPRRGARSRRSAAPRAGRRAIGANGAPPTSPSGGPRHSASARRKDSGRRRVSSLPASASPASTTRRSNRRRSSCSRSPAASTYPGARVTRSSPTGPSERRSCEIRTRSAAEPALGGSSPQTSSMSRSLETTSPAWSSSTESSARCRAPATSTRRPASPPPRAGPGSGSRSQGHLESDRTRRPLRARYGLGRAARRVLLDSRRRRHETQRGATCSSPLS